MGALAGLDTSFDECRTHVLYHVDTAAELLLGGWWPIEQRFWPGMDDNLSFWALGPRPVRLLCPQFSWPFVFLRLLCRVMGLAAAPEAARSPCQCLSLEMPHPSRSLCHPDAFLPGLPWTCLQWLTDLTILFSFWFHRCLEWKSKWTEVVKKREL